MSAVLTATIATTGIAKDLTELARNQQDYVVATRRELHRIPETRYETPKTRSLIKNEINKLTGVHDGVVESKGGLVFNLEVKPELPWVCFRADFDALPVTENTGLAFASTNAGKMHACGHDAHTAMLLGALRAMAEKKVTPRCNIRFLFQDAEENPGTAPEPISGGDLLVREGVMEKVGEVYGLHIWSNPEMGKPNVFFSRPGPLMGNSGRVKFVFKSSGGHVMRPSSGVNALRVVQAVMNRLDSFVARNCDPLEPTTLEPVILNAGKGSNIMPGEAELWYGFRTMLPRDKHMALMDKIEAEVRRVVEGMDAQVTEVKKIGGHPALINDAQAFEKVRRLLEDTAQRVAIHPPVLGGEDFAYYLFKRPGCFFFLGAHTPGTGDHHSPTFQPDESVFWRGVLYWLLLATQ